MDAVLNWLWQGGLVALAAAALVRTTPGCPARTRYCVLWAACIVVLALPGAPFLFSPGSTFPTARELTTSGFVISMPRAWWTSNTVVFGLWSVWAVVCTCQLAVAVRELRRTRKECRRVPRMLETHLRHWSRVKTAGRQADLMLSTRVRSAAMLGCGSPIIALAPALVEHLSDEDLDRVVIHEWAHVQRRDDIAQYFHFVVRMVAGWHPAIWWLQRQLNLEREVACDEAAVAATGSAKAYAACLTTVAALPGCRRPFPALAVSSSGLGRRVIRILALRQSSAEIPAYGLVAAAAVAFATLAPAVGSMRLVTTAAALTSHNATAPTMEQNVATAARPAGSAPQELRSTGPMTARRSRLAGEPFAGGGHGSSRAVTVEPKSTTELAASTGSVPSSAREASLDSPAVGPHETLEALALPVNTLMSLESASPGDTGERDRGDTRAAWAAAADAGIAIGRGSQSAGVATAGFFSQFGKKLARSF